MKSQTKITTGIGIFLILSVGAYYMQNLYAAGNKDTGYAKAPASGYELLDTPVGCQMVSNPSGSAIFVPTKSAGEWNNFSANAPSSVGVSIAVCPPVYMVPGWDSGGCGDGGSCGVGCS